MRVKDILNATKTLFSFEFYPPKSKVEWDKLFLVISDLSYLKPAYVSVTYGAGGSTRERTYELVVSIQEQMGLPVVAHLTCIGSTRDEVCAILEQYAENGVNNILALRGDSPKGQTEWTGVENGFVYAADLVAFIKRHFPDMGIGVAGFPEGHPGTPNRLKEIEYLKAKVDAGADYIVRMIANLQLLWPGDALASGNEYSLAYLALAALYASLYTLGALALAVALFYRRQIS